MTRGAIIHDLPMGLIFNYTPTRLLDAIEYSGAVQRHKEELLAKRKI